MRIKIYIYCSGLDFVKIIWLFSKSSTWGILVRTFLWGGAGCLKRIQETDEQRINSSAHPDMDLFWYTATPKICHELVHPISPDAPCMVYLPTKLGDFLGKCW